jgi:Putative zinc-finger
MLTCNDAYGLIVRTIDDPRITAEERAALRQHLASCAPCRAEYETQHEVRRLLALHIQDRLPAGFADRLNARLTQTSRPSAIPRWLDVQAVQHHDTRGRAWALRLIPLAATLALIVAGTSVRDVAAPPAISSPVPSDAGADAGMRSGAQSDAPTSFTRTHPGTPRAFTTIVLPRHDQSLRRDRPSRESTDDVAQSPLQPLADDGAPNGGVAAMADSPYAGEDGSRGAASRIAKEMPRASDIGGDRLPAAEPRGQDRERIAGRVRDARGERNTRTERDARGERDAEAERDASGERAASQRPGIMPRPAAPFPHARPAMPAPPVMLPDRSIPPW